MKGFLAALVVFVLAGFGYYYYTNSVQEPEETKQSQQQATQSPGDSSEENAGSAGDISTIIYSDEGFTPENTTVEVGTTVVFVNESDREMWVASDPHPVHTDYSAFDSREGVAVGETYSFTFDEPGSYDYHDHLTPSRTGVVVVE